MPHNKLGDAGAAALGAALATAGALELLDVAACEIGPRGALVLAVGARKALKLKALDVSENPVGSAAAAALAGLVFEGLSVSLRNCDLGRDHHEVHWDWLHRLPVLPGADPTRRAPWRFRFKLDDALERAVCEETLRLFAGRQRCGNL